jgi:hypothetical protein
MSTKAAAGKTIPLSTDVMANQVGAARVCGKGKVFLLSGDLLLSWLANWHAEQKLYGRIGAGAWPKTRADVQQAKLAENWYGSTGEELRQGWVVEMKAAAG